MHLQSLATYMQVSYMQLTCTSKNDVEKKKKSCFRPNLNHLFYGKYGKSNLYSTKSLCESFVIRKKLQKCMFDAKSVISSAAHKKCSKHQANCLKFPLLCLFFSPKHKQLEKDLFPGA